MDSDIFTWDSRSFEEQVQLIDRLYDTYVLRYEVPAEDCKKIVTIQISPDEQTGRSKY
jgi:hypothetical protein